MRIFAALIAVGVLLFVVRSYYVGFLLDSLLTVLGAATVVAAVVVLIRVGQHYEWTGFGKLVQPKPDNEDIQPRKTLWDWLQLLIVPVALAGIGFWFTVQQDARQQQIENQRAKQTQKIENQRAEAERELAEQRAQDEALQADLSEANLSNADLVYADLSGADLFDADLSDADLRYADLSDAQAITNEELEQQAASLKGATMPNGQKYEDWIKSKNRKEEGKNDGSP